MYTRTCKQPSRWSAREVELLKKVYAVSTPDRLKELFPARNITAIYRKASSLGLVRIQNEWSQQELDTLIRLYPIMSARQVKKYLPGRSLKAIYVKAYNLCLSAYDHSITDTIIRNSYGRCSLSLIARRIGCSRSCVHYRAQLLGLR